MSNLNAPAILDSLQTNALIFRRFVKLNRQTISDIENDQADLTIRSVNKLFCRIGMELQLAPQQH